MKMKRSGKIKKTKQCTMESTVKSDGFESVKVRLCDKKCQSMELYGESKTATQDKNQVSLSPWSWQYIDKCRMQYKGLVLYQLNMYT